MPRSVVVLLANQSGREMVREICKANGMRFAEFEELIQVGVEQMGKHQQTGLWDSFDDILDRIQVKQAEE